MTMIFCVEDDAGIRDLMIYTLNASGFRAVGFENAKEFYTALADTVPELIMLDIMLPGEDGISILKRLKADARTADIPVIMATAKGNEYDKVIGLDLGADDYLAKPFGMMGDGPRCVRAVLRRSGRAAEKQKLIRVGGLEMNLGEHIVTADGIRIQLTLKEFELLRTFMTNPGRRSRASSCCPRYGARIFWAKRARLMSTSARCARSSAAAASISAPFAAWAIDWRCSGNDQTHFSLDLRRCLAVVLLASFVLLRACFTSIFQTSRWISSICRPALPRRASSPPARIISVIWTSTAAA